MARSTAPQRITANAELFDFELSEEEVQQLDALERAQRTYCGTIVRCREAARKDGC